MTICLRCACSDYFESENLVRWLHLPIQATKVTHFHKGCLEWLRVVCLRRSLCHGLLEAPFIRLSEGEFPDGMLKIDREKLGAADKGVGERVNLLRRRTVVELSRVIISHQVVDLLFRVFETTATTEGPQPAYLLNDAGGLSDLCFVKVGL